MYGLVFTDPKGNTVFQVSVVDRPLTVGRANDVDIALPFKAVSRYHARFFTDGQVLYVEDLGSSNGVQVGGIRIAGPTPLTPGAFARIGVINVTVTGAGVRAGELAPDAGIDEVPTDPRLSSSGHPAYQPQRQALPTPMAVGPVPSPYVDARAASGAVPPGPASPFDEPQQPYYQPPRPSGPPVDSATAPGGPPTGMTPGPARLGSGSGSAPAWAQPELPPGSGAVPASAPPPGAEPEPSPEEPTVALPVSPRLVGTGGYMKDRVFYLDAVEFTVGRVKGSTLVIEDASVSRNHAKIISKDGTYVLYDIRSFNGTFVDDDKVTRRELTGGERVRFGDIEFSFLLHDAPDSERDRRKRKPSRRRRLVILGSAVVVLAALVAAANILRDRRPPPPPPDPLAEERAREAKVRQHLERASAELRRRDWDGATETLHEVLKLDPLNDEAVDGLEKARSEKEVGGWIDEAERIGEAGRDLERAKGLLTKVPAESSYYAEARLGLRQLSRTMAEEARNRGLSLCRAWRYEECQEQLCRFFQTWPSGEPIPDEVRVRRALERAEAKLARRHREEFEPCKIPEPGTGDAEADRELAERFPEERIRGAVIAYFQGHADEGVRTLGTLEKRREYREHGEAIGALIESMIRVQTASADLHRDVRGSALADAERSYETLKRADARIVPKGLESRYVREAAKLLGDAYHDVGEEHMRGGRLREAYESWSKGKSLAPSHPGILQSLLVLESRAREACQSARERALAGDTSGAVSHFELCRDITPTTSPLHQGAEEGLRQLGQ